MEIFILSLVLFIILVLMLFGSFTVIVAISLYNFRRFIKSLYAKYRYGNIMCLQRLRIAIKYSIQKYGNSYIFNNKQIMIHTTSFPDEDMMNAIINSIREVDLPCGYIATVKVSGCSRIVSVFRCGELVCRITTHKKFHNSYGIIRVKKLEDVKSCYI